MVDAINFGTPPDPVPVPTPGTVGAAQATVQTLQQQLDDLNSASTDQSLIDYHNKKADALRAAIVAKGGTPAA